MDELLQKSLPFVLPALAPVLAMLAAPLLGVRLRRLVAAGLALVPAGLLLDLLLCEHGGTLRLEVPSVFARGESAEPFVFTVDVVEAPVWQWHVVAAVYFAVAALCVIAVRGPRPRTPRPAALAVLVFAWALAARLALEKTAAHVGIVWALGTTATSLTALPFVGWYAGARGLGVAGFARAVLLAALLQRALLAAVGLVATLGGLGTHLDVRAVTDLALPGIGVVEPDGPFAAWLWAIFVPQLVLALLATAVLGLVLGAVPFWLAKRRAARG